jgi:hypothetical protein
MPPVGFEPTISAGKRLQTYALDGAATDSVILLGKKKVRKNPISGLDRP